MPPFNKPVMGILGIVFLIAGLVMVLAWWPDVVILFRGAIGFILALAGLLTLYTVKELK